ncbi:hypothetical protein DPMN_044896 [Dreissena polymorpha]|uniref:Uncharacterized protein n=1 Tax=Dreissena polymorpha TaxID=45954 RepID=A0A9D4HWU6_DREPO|nr:hypothetical protein DPMN_044896 [Dreissena polymorpha]
MLLQEKGVEDSESYLVRNPNPYTIGPRDVAPVAEDTLSQAVDMAFPDGLDFLDNVMEAPQYVPRPYTPDMSAARLDTPRPKEHTPSRVNNAATSPAIMDSLPTIEECRQLKGNQSVSSSSSSSSSSSGKTSCEGCCGVLKELEGIKGMLRGIKSQLEMQGNTNQQLTMTMVKKSRRNYQLFACTACPDAACCPHDTAHYAYRGSTAESRQGSEGVQSPS